MPVEVRGHRPGDPVGTTIRRPCASSATNFAREARARRSKQGTPADRGLADRVDSLPETLFRVALHGFRREGRKARGDIFGAALLGRAVADPLPGMGDDGLAGANISTPPRCSTRSKPRNTNVYSSTGVVCPGSTHPAGLRMCAMLRFFRPRIDSSDVFIDELGPVTRGLDARRRGNRCGRAVLLPSAMIAGEAVRPGLAGKLATPVYWHFR